MCREGDADVEFTTLFEKEKQNRLHGITLGIGSKPITITFEAHQSRAILQVCRQKYQKASITEKQEERGSNET
ncbi:hypothetical protein MHYP_G00109620 [Metynnis hypsauchen]